MKNILSVLVSGIILGLVFLLAYGYLIEPNFLFVTQKPIYIKNLSPAFEGKRIVQISDLHGKKYLFGNPLVHKVNNLKADYIVITGDVWDGRYPSLTYGDVMIAPLKAKEGKFFVFGNNEYSLSKPNHAVIKLQSLGVTVLRNQNVALSQGQNRLWLIGVDDPHKRKADLKKALKGVSSGPKILLAHSPEIFHEAQKAGIDLVLAGHTHGGQVNLPGFAGLITNVRPGFEKYRAGWFQEGGTQLYVNRGIGMTRLPLRIFAPPEITLFILHKDL